ncbi:hypothetical protein MSI_17070 [Treponema sp. JC4]|uniref:hypothetical protein n=1 Tax=Treponema sp. JC4 TaxID=1124982 RepID=UPI00025AFD7E|nr:hypothetical protein [Treponema sp. JC4]EID84839.1 hypothetical protein MSI_17070 [Treponema sp. JC4]
MFTIKGIIDGEELRLTYNDGEISGDSKAIARTLTENRKDYGYLGLFPDATDRNYLNEEVPAYYLIYNHVFEKVTEHRKDWPPEDINAVY